MFNIILTWLVLSVGLTLVSCLCQTSLAQYEEDILILDTNDEGRGVASGEFVVTLTLAS